MTNKVCKVCMGRGSFPVEVESECECLVCCGTGYIEEDKPLPFKVKRKLQEEY